MIMREETTHDTKFLTNSFAVRWLLKTLVARNDSAPGRNVSTSTSLYSLRFLYAGEKKYCASTRTFQRSAITDDFRSSNAVSSVRGTDCLLRTFPDRPPFTCPFCTKQAMCSLASLSIRLPDPSGEQMSGFHVIDFHVIAPVLVEPSDSRPIHKHRPSRAAGHNPPAAAAFKFPLWPPSYFLDNQAA